MTALVTSAVPFDIRKSVADEIMKTEKNCEQIGFLSFKNKDCNVLLEMTGGEFCGNATMCGAIAAFLKEKNADSTYDTKVFKVKICEKIYEVNVTQLSGKDFECQLSSSNAPDGIAHKVVEINAPLSREEKTRAELEIKGLSGDEARGLMFLNGTQLEPLVYVPKADTLFWENACASGCMAVGKYLYEKNKRDVDIDLSMPGGSINVKCSKGAVMLTEKIRLVSETSLFYT